MTPLRGTAQKTIYLCAHIMYTESMAETKTIALDKEAYNLLRMQKGADESFSDVVKRIAGRRRKLSDFAGVWKAMSREELRRIEDAIERGRELDRERAAALLKRMG